MTVRYPLVLNGTLIEELQSGDTLAGTSAFDAGTTMLFVQTAAPTGWTKSTTHDNKALRIVSGVAGSGGTTSFTSVFGSRMPTGTINASGLSAEATTLSTAQMPSHNHTLYWGNGASGAVADNAGYAYADGSGAKTSIQRSYTITIANNGSGSSHSHSVSGSASFTGTTMDFNIQYVDAIIATKD